MYDPSPKITEYEIDSVTYIHKDEYFLTVEFIDPDTGEALLGDFSLRRWLKPPSDVEKDIRDRLMNPIVNVAGRKS